MRDEKTRPEGADELEEVAGSIGGVLLNTIPDMFKIEQADANTIVQDVFVCWLSDRNVAALPADWITASACSSASALQRAREAARAAANAAGDGTVFSVGSPYAKILTALSEPERRVLYLIYVERKTFWDIARELNVTIGYAKRIARGAAGKLHRYAEETVAPGR